MDREAFKQRMKSLKSYREQNPGKGYWDWKVDALAGGGIADGEVTDGEVLVGPPTYEGKQQNNCVGKYYNTSIREGDNLIYFLRHKDTPNTSCVTCRYSKMSYNRRTVEHRTKNNCNTNREQEEIIDQIDKLINKTLYGVG